MQYLFRASLLLLSCLSTSGANEWLYYKHFPWVYDFASKDWFYLSGTDGGKIYAYKASSKTWIEFSADTSTPLSFDDTNLTFELNSSVELEMIYCPSGTFSMGSNFDEDGRSDGEVKHQVTLSNHFYLGKFEVTQAQYEIVMKDNSSGLNPTPSSFANKPNHPVENVSYDDIQVFLEQINSQLNTSLPEGWCFDLPTEAQWEYACRAGTTTAYSWGDYISTGLANYSASYERQTNEVNSYSPNNWGFYNMHGNVNEWTADFMGDYGGDTIDPTGPSSAYKSRRVTRGGNWKLESYFLRSAQRFYGNPDSRGNNLGFRVCLVRK